MKKFLTLFLFFIPFLLFTSCISDEEPEVFSLQPGDSCPEFTVTMNDGTSVSTSSLRGSVGMIVFFNTSCPDCRRELPEIQEVSERIASENLNVNILCIARAEETESIEKFWEANSMTLPYSPQPDTKIYNLFASSVIPRIYIISPSLTITAAWSDNPMPTAEEIIEKLKAAL